MKRLIKYKKRIYQLVRRPITFFRRKLTQYYIISFPKSGRTWIRFFLASYFKHFFDIPLTFNQAKIFQRKDLPRFNFSHLDANDKELHMSYDFLRGKSVLFILRDPRDVAVSYYFQMTKRQDLVDEHQMSIDEFIMDERFGITRTIAFINKVYAHKEHFASMDVVTYEELKKDPNSGMSRVLNYLDMSVDADVLEQALADSSFENMKKLETQGKVKEELLANPNKKDPEAFKVRKGKVGGYVDYLSPEAIAYCNKSLKDLHPDLQNIYEHTT